MNRFVNKTHTQTLYWLTRVLTLLMMNTYSMNSDAANTYDLPLAVSAVVIQIKPHNSTSFTQGWVKEGDFFYESSGLYGHSFIQYHRASDPFTIMSTAKLPAHYFAEGLTLLNHQIYLLTWKSEVMLILNKETLAIENSLPYKGEGWGLTHNGSQLIMSNGSSQLLFRDPNDFSIKRRITIKQPLQLNELEYVDGIIWANDWNKDSIYGINSKNGCIIVTIDLSAIRRQAVTPNRNNILNGIAYDRQAHGLWITGKYWPARYLIDYPSINLEILNHSSC
ncbi:MAG: glutamine cyclotransferase [Candidatus Endobugula sp.]